MSKFRTSILIFGILIVGVAVSLLTVLVLYATGVILTDPIELVFTIEDEQKIYDGTPLKAEEYSLTSGELLKGHTLQVEFTGSQTDAGESESDLKVKVLNEKGFDVSKEYAVKTEKGTLTVAPVEINVELYDGQVPYNGKQIDFNDYLVTEGALVRGHKIVAVSDTVLLEAGKKLTKEDLHVLVYDLFDNPVTQNYVLNFEMEGTVEVVQREIALKPVGATKIYDGLELVCDSYEITSDLKLAPNQTASVEFFSESRGVAAKITNAGELRVQIDQQNFKILDEVGNDVTDNYYVDFGTDLLKIEKRGLTLTAKSGSWVYDGQEHTYSTERDVYLVEGLVAGDEITSVTYSGSITDVGTAKNEIVGIEFLGGKKSDNYMLVCISGTLEVTKMSVTVNPKPIIKEEYDGQTLGDYVNELNETLYDTVPALPQGFKIDSQTDVENIVDAGSGVYTLNDVKVLNAADEDCTKNFALSIGSGWYRIDKKDLTVKLSEVKKTYNATAQTVGVEEAFNGITLPEGLATSDFELVCAQEGFKNAGTYTYSAKFAEGNEKAKNYALTVTPGSVIIQKYNVSIVLEELGSKSYDGTLATLESNYVLIEEYDGRVLQDALAYIEKYTYSVTQNVKAMTQTVTVNSVSIYIDGEDVTGNLIIDYEGAHGDITLEARGFTVVVLDAITDNVSMLIFEIAKYITSPSLVGSDTIKVPDGAAYASGGKIWVDVTLLKIENAAGEEVTHLYFIEGDTMVSGNYVLKS